jgi:hypothetical protein
MAIVANEGSAISVVAVRHAKARSRFKIGVQGSEERIGTSRAGIVTEARSFGAEAAGTAAARALRSRLGDCKSRSRKGFTLFKP